MPLDTHRTCTYLYGYYVVVFNTSMHVFDSSRLLMHFITSPRNTHQPAPVTPTALPCHPARPIAPPRANLRCRTSRLQPHCLFNNTNTTPPTIPSRRTSSIPPPWPPVHPESELDNDTHPATHPGREGTSQHCIGEEAPSTLPPWLQANPVYPARHAHRARRHHHPLRHCLYRRQQTTQTKTPASSPACRVPRPCASPRPSRRAMTATA